MDAKYSINGMKSYETHYNGYKMVFLESAFLSKYVIHLNHATMVLHPELGARKKALSEKV